MKALDFLNEVISSIGYQVGPTGEIIVMLPTEEGYVSDVVTSASSYPFVFPNNENLKNLLSLDEKTGNIDLKYLPFNPVMEDDISYETEAFQALLKRMQIMLTVETFETGSLLLRLLMDDKAIRTKGLRIEKYLKSIGEHISEKTKNVVDKTTIKNFNSIIHNGTKLDNKKLLHVTVKKRGEIAGRVYPVVTSIYFPLVEEIYNQSGTEDAIVNDVKLRKKDILVFKDLFQCLLPMLDQECVYRVGSDRNDFPLFSSSYRLYLEIMLKHKELIEKLKNLKDDGFDPLSLTFNLTPESLDDTVASIYNEIKRIPSEKTLKGTYIQPEQTEEIQSVSLPTVPQQQQPVQQAQPVQQQMVVPQQQPQQVQQMQPVQQYAPAYNPLNPYPQQMANPMLVDNTSYMGNNMTNMIDQVNYGQMPYNQMNPYGMTGPMYPVYHQPQQNNVGGGRLPLGLTGQSEF